MSLQIGTRNFDVSTSFRDKVLSSVKTDSLIDKKELESLKESAVSEDEKSVVELLEKQENTTAVNISATSDDGIEANTFKFNIKVEKTEESEENENLLTSEPATHKYTELGIDFGVKIADKVFENVEEFFTKKEVEQINAILDIIDSPALKEKYSEDLNNIIEGSGSVASKKVALKEVQANLNSFFEANQIILKVEKPELQTFLKSEVDAILKNDGLSPKRKSELIDVISQETKAFSTRQVKLTSDYEALKLKHPPEKITTEIAQTDSQIKQLEALIKDSGEKPELTTQLKALKDKLADSKKIKRELDSFDKTISTSDEVRLKDIVASTKKSFGPPYTDVVANKINDLLESKPELKKIFNSPEDVNIAIRKFPSELKPEELQALKQIRESFHNIPVSGLPVVKVSLPNDKFPSLEKFVIEADHLKAVKTPEELVDLLKLDYKDSPFVKNGKPTFKLDEIQVTVGKIYPNEVKIPYSSDFVEGGRNSIIYQYPFAGNGFTTPENGFPKPELDLKAPIPDSEVKVIKWNDFTEGNVSEIAPKRNVIDVRNTEVKPSPETKPSADVEGKNRKVKPSPEAKPSTDVEGKNPEVKPNPETKPSADVESKNREVKPNPETKPSAGVEGKNSLQVPISTNLEDRLKNLPINDETKTLLRGLSEKPEFKKNPHVLEHILESFEKAGTNETSLKVVTSVLKDAKPEDIIKAFESRESSEKILALSDKLLPFFEKFGLPYAEAVSKVIKGLDKILPVIGIYSSATDAFKLGEIALKGKSSEGVDFTKYPVGDPRNTPENLEKLKDIRALALLGSAANSLDTVLAVFEATPAGIAATLAQLGLAGVEVAIDFAVDYFREHPDKMPKELCVAIKAASLATSIIAPPLAPAVAQIYGLSGMVDIATELTKLSGDATVKGIKTLNNLSTKALDSKLQTFSNDLNTLADIIRNPEKYAKEAGLKVEEVLSEATNALKSIASKGGDLAKKAFNLLVDVSSNPAKYGKLAADKAIEIGKSVYTGVKSSVAFAEKLVETGALKVEQAYQYLSNITVSGINAGKEFVSQAIKSVGHLGTKFTAFAKDFYANPQKYGQKAVEIINSLETSVKNGSIVAFNKLESIAKSGVQGAKAAINKSLEVIAGAGKLTLEYAKYVVSHPAEASQKLLQATKNTLISLAKAGENTLDYLKNLQGELKGSLGNFSDTLVQIAKEGGVALKEIFTKHFDVIKNRLPEILSAGGNVASAIKDQLVKYVPAAALVNSLIQAGPAAFNLIVDLTSKSADIAKQFVNTVTKDFSDAWKKCGKLDYSPLINVIEKYYDKAVALGGVMAEKAKALLYSAISSLDKNSLGDYVPDWTYSALKPHR